MMLIALLSIYAIAAAAAALNRVIRTKLCLVCAGVSGTWLWLLVARRMGVAVDPVILGIFLGGSVVGIAYQTAKRLPTNRSVIGWKLMVIPPGFVAAYGAARGDAMLTVIGLALGFLAAAWFWRSKPHDPSRTEVASLERDMKNCC